MDYIILLIHNHNKISVEIIIANCSFNKNNELLTYMSKYHSTRSGIINIFEGY